MQKTNPGKRQGHKMDKSEVILKMKVKVERADSI